ncbi:MAG: hypothetical protein WC749_12155 [Dehalococcoidia bacterium]
MEDIIIRSPKPNKHGHFFVDVMAGFPGGLRHISRLNYTDKGLYDVPLTLKSGVDLHNSYHPRGEQHGKLTRGKLFLSPENQLLGKAKPHTENKEVLLWEKKGQPWDSLKGVQDVGYQPNGFGFANIDALEAGYPIVTPSDDDCVFTIDANTLRSKMISVRYFLVETDNVGAFKQRIDEITTNFRDLDTKVTWRPHQYLTVEKAAIYTTRSPWLAIMLFSKVARI